MQATDPAPELSFFRRLWSLFARALAARAGAIEIATEKAAAVDRVAVADLVDRLSAAGFYSHARAHQIPALKNEACEIGWLYGAFPPAEPDEDESSPATGRIYFADAEDLAEGGVGRFLEEISPFLRQEGVVLPTVSEEYDENAYSVQVGDEKLVMWEGADWHARSDYHYPWQLTPERAFAFVNRVLAQAGSPERLFAISGGEDLVAVFLTDEQFDIIRKHPALTNQEKVHRIEEDD